MSYLRLSPALAVSDSPDSLSPVPALFKGILQMQWFSTIPLPASLLYP